jgi:GNAT superfamily N-acetyltransferase
VEIAPIRPATAADLPGIRGVADEHDLRGLWPGGDSGPDFLDAELAYGRLGVAVPDGVVTGFTGTFRRGHLTHLGDLFLRTGHQSRGLGTALLDWALSGAEAVVTFASADPRAMALYLRAGLVPRVPLVYLEGQLREAPSAVTDSRDGDLEHALQLDAAASGGARADLLRWYAGVEGVRVTTAGDSYAFTRTLGDRVIIGPAGGAPAVEAALRAAIGHHLHLAVPGGHPLLPRLVRAGLRIDELDTVMTTSPAVVDFGHYLPSADLG